MLQSLEFTEKNMFKTSACTRVDRDYEEKSHIQLRSFKIIPLEAISCCTLIFTPVILLTFISTPVFCLVARDAIEWKRSSSH